ELWRDRLSACAGVMSTQTYISLPMRRRRVRKKHREAVADREAVVYRDRSSWALDAQLASRASAGDDAAFTTLVTRFQPAVFRWALIFARDPDEAEDITQEVFVRTHRQIGDYRSDGPFEAWLYRITRRAATQMRRTRKRRGRLALTPVARPLRDVYTTGPDCGPLATMLRDREYNAATILNTLPPMSNPISVAETAGMLARRRRVGKVVVFLTGSALVATIWVMLFVTGFGRMMIGAD